MHSVFPVPLDKPKQTGPATKSIQVMWLGQLPLGGGPTGAVEMLAAVPSLQALTSYQAYSSSWRFQHHHGALRRTCALNCVVMLAAADA